MSKTSNLFKTWLPRVRDALDLDGATIRALRAELADYRQAAEVEAAEADRLRAEVDRLEAEYAEQKGRLIRRFAEVERLQAELAAYTTGGAPGQRGGAVSPRCRVCDRPVHTRWMGRWWHHPGDHGPEVHAVVTDTDDILDENGNPPIDLHVKCKAEVERLQAELAPFIAECDAVGIPHDAPLLVRHHRGQGRVIGLADARAGGTVTDTDGLNRKLLMEGASYRVPPQRTDTDDPLTQALRWLNGEGIETDEHNADVIIERLVAELRRVSADAEAYKAMYDDLHEATGCVDGLAYEQLRERVSADADTAKAAAREALDWIDLVVVNAQNRRLTTIAEDAGHAQRILRAGLAVPPPTPTEGP